MNAQVLDTYKLKSFNVSTIDHVRNTYQNNNFKDSIECVTGDVNDQIMNLVASHDVCASSYAMTGNYVDAIQGAKLMIKLMPLAGYLRLGDLHTLHSNHFKAMKAYQQAMSYIDGENDNDGSCKAHLKKRYEYAKTRTESHTDMINKLPREILDIIMIEHLTLSDRIVLLDVCQSWRNVAASSHSWWSSIKCDGGRHGLTADELFNLSCHVGHHILDMEIYVNRYENFDVIFTQMINGKFNHLKKLTIKCK
ncbi:hypothetical protein INT45_003428 [Circinella minor]|uniref:F-box domain-containing protein n=1 Tax=Circinella minor TaxID=1195481 RepID=A0A8H7S5D2_9FUNG|nr:hypothetical protein INT45_003428 [Circinella minor]